MKNVDLRNATVEQSFSALLQSQLDITGPVQVDVSSSFEGSRTLWVNINGVCVLRVNQIANLEGDIVPWRCISSAEPDPNKD